MTGSDNRYDVIVLGVGGMGSATTYHLADRGLDVVGLDQYNIPHARGSSHGSTRVFNLALRGEPAYAALARRADELWDELEERSPEQLRWQTGTLRGWPSATYDGLRGTLEEAVDVSEALGLEYERLSGAEVSARFPGFQPPDEYRFLHHSAGGMLDVERCVSAHVQAAVAAGADVRARERVTGWEVDGGTVRVETARAAYEADHLVVTAGPWAPTALPALADHLDVYRSVMAWFTPRTPEPFRPAAFPAFSMDTRGGYFYGTPIHELPGVKVGGSASLDDRTPVDPDAVDLTPEAGDAAELRAYVADVFPDAAGAPTRVEPCLLTYSPDSDFIIDRHPDHEQVLVACGFSGSGFMVSAAVGETLARLVSGESLEYDLEAFSVDRLE